MENLAWEVLNPRGDVIAYIKHAEDAAALVGSLGEHNKIFHRKQLVWHEGHEKFSASESYDGAAEIMLQRAGRAS